MTDSVYQRVHGSGLGVSQGAFGLLTLRSDREWPLLGERFRYAGSFSYRYEGP